MVGSNLGLLLELISHVGTLAFWVRHMYDCSNVRYYSSQIASECRKLLSQKSSDQFIHTLRDSIERIMPKFTKILVFRGHGLIIGEDPNQAPTAHITASHARSLSEKNAANLLGEIVTALRGAAQGQEYSGDNNNDSSTDNNNDSSTDSSTVILDNNMVDKFVNMLFDEVRHLNTWHKIENHLCVFSPLMSNEDAWYELSNFLQQY